MIGLESVVISIAQWIGTAAVNSVFIVILIIAVKKALGNRISPKWHYRLWFVLIAKLFMPWSWLGPLNIEEWIPYRTTPVPRLDTTYVWTPQTADIAEAYSGGSSIVLIVLFCIWLTGALISIARPFFASRRFARRLRKLSLVDEPAVLQLLEECKKQLSINKNVRLVSSDIVSGPALFGYFRPYLLVPHLQEVALDENRLRYVLLHELSHIKRHDIAALWVMQILSALQWFNPVQWYAFRRMREDQEAACDALALSRIQPDESLAYGHTLLEFLERNNRSMKIAGIASMADRLPQLRRRIVLIRSFRKVSRLSSLIGAAILILLVLFVSSFGITKAQAAFALSSIDGSAVEDRYMPMSHFDYKGKETRFYVLITKRTGEWKIEFLSAEGKPDPKWQNGVEGTLVMPETGYYSRPGTRDLVFKKGPSDQDWKFVSFEDY